MRIPALQILLDRTIQKPIISLVVVFLSMKSTKDNGSIKLEVIPSLVTPFAKECVFSFQNQILVAIIIIALLLGLCFQHARQIDAAVATTNNDGRTPSSHTREVVITHHGGAMAQQ